MVLPISRKHSERLMHMLRLPRKKNNEARSFSRSAPGERVPSPKELSLRGPSSKDQILRSEEGTQPLE